MLLLVEAEKRANLKTDSVLTANAQTVKQMIMRKNLSSGGFIKSEIKKKLMHLSSMNFVKTVHSIAVLLMATLKAEVHENTQLPYKRSSNR